ncbi:unnamed protein product [Medioppia subpectinata]|uniref:Protein kinase domain-containing protein n=1 Tax=Medioppia subpectinata TaxID=1979941 RepID=A0A7R9KTL4_9ACAR|nr:unnamed protein product [Medioppia subpectinata]CAG2109584.1 unnamed protein product [Medioppia subpectinata]
MYVIKHEIIYISRLQTDFILTADLLGSGAFGADYAVKKVLIDDFDEDNKNRVLKEVKTLAKLDSHFVVKYYYSWIEEKHLYIQMEYCSQTLGSVLKDKQQVFGRQSAKAMNIFDHNTFMKLGDFGLAIEHDRPSQSHTQCVGTPQYMAPDVGLSKKYDIKKKEITIVLLGESGVGKSTFINALVNYLSYESLELANGQPICLIPIHFTLTDPKTWTPVKVTLGEHNINENTDDPTKSATQYPKCYKFEDNNIVLNIIDTPGIGDTDGVDRDNRNMQNILDFISNYREINAFCVLLKPNEARLDVLFNIANNILFLFTNSRSTHFMPGDSGPALKDILQQTRNGQLNIKIPYDENTIYCFDSESFRYLVASVPPNNIEFDPRFKSNYIESWNRSADECRRVFAYITKLTPHKVMDTLSLNNAKQIIQLLTKPLADITKNIIDNIKQCESYKQQIIAEPRIATNQNNQAIELQYIRLAKPRTTKTVLKTMPVDDNNTRVKSITTESADTMIQHLNRRIAELAAERETIINSMAMFACFLANNTLTAFPDAFDDYIRYLMVSQADGTDANSPPTIDRFEQLLNSYRHKKQTIIDNLPDEAVITPTNVYQNG